MRCSSSPPELSRSTGRSRIWAQSRLNVLVGFPLGGMLSLAIAACAAMVLLPQPDRGDVAVPEVMPVVAAGGKLALGVRRSSASWPPRSARRWRPPCPAATRWPSSSAGPGASSVGPAQAARFHRRHDRGLVVGVAVLLTGVDPIMVTEYSVVFSAIALPLTYLPILVVANDPRVHGRADQREVDQHAGARCIW